MLEMAQVGARIVAERVKRGWTQQTLAGMVESSQSTIAGYESGRREPSLAKLSQISEALGVSLSVLICNDDVPETLCLDHDESSLVEYYRKCDRELRRHVMATARLCATRLNA